MLRRAIEEANPVGALRADNRSKAWVGFLMADVLHLNRDDKNVKSQMWGLQHRLISTGHLEEVDGRDHASGRPARFIAWKQGSRNE